MKLRPPRRNRVTNTQRRPLDERPTLTSDVTSSSASVPVGAGSSVLDSSGPGSSGPDSASTPTPSANRREVPAARPPRVVVEAVRPVVDAGAFASKSSLGVSTTVLADVFTDGHDVVFAQLDLFAPTDASPRSTHARSTQARSTQARANSARSATSGSDPSESVRMVPLGNDRFSADFVLDRLGRWTYDVRGWVSHAETWRRGTVIKSDAGLDTTVEAAIGRALVDDMLATPHDAASGVDLTMLKRLRKRLDSGDVSSLDDPDLTDVFFRTEQREPVGRFASPLPIDVDPKLGTIGAWYSFFPRSPAGRSDDAATTPLPATLIDAIDRLDYIAALGFDVVYIPPVHPIGTTNRKGKNNSTLADADDVGSPYAIGSADGGHCSVAPELGTVDDVTALADGCRERGMELALDIAFNCSPDHPWVHEHPEWFVTRPDGSIQYAENPPKKYEDIYPLDFESTEWSALWHELADVFRFWIDKGVKIFRVDNPHTKSFAFWQWAISAIRHDHPDVIFLSEAFTRPRVMQRLAKLGFNQSYTYFAWRNTAAELQEYFEELASETIDFLRPNVWPNTHDILTEELQRGGRAGFISRAILAATMSPSWGIYGPVFELMEMAPRPGVEDYLDSEKYEVRHWDLTREDSLVPLISRLNTIRRAQPALCDLASIRFHQTEHDSLLCFTKTDPTGVGDPVLVIANVDPHAPASGFVDIDLAAVGLPYGSDYDVVDHLGGVTYRWTGNRNFVELSPYGSMAHIFTVHAAPGHGANQTEAD